MTSAMSQTSPTESPVVLNTVEDVNFNELVDLPKSINKRHRSKKSVALLQEAYPGELLSLRQQANNNSLKPSVDKTTPTTSTNVFDQLLADQLIDVMPTGIVMLDGNGVVVKINQVARNLLDEPILGQPWMNVIERSFNPQKDDWHEVSLKDGRRVKLEISSLGDQPGQLIMITDLTETRLLQDKISQMQRLSSLGKMVSTLAHQIRTPLSAAILYGENLATNKLAAGAREKFQEKLNARLHDLEQQVNDMLLFSKSGKEQVVAPVNVNELVHGAVASMEMLFEKSNVEINLQLADEDVKVLGNKNALNGAIQNLLHNATEAFQHKKISNPLINIQLYSHKQHLYLSFKDNGPGISSDIAHKIFQPFYTSSSKGTGLGLAVVKSVVNAHQGEVNLLKQSVSNDSSGAHFFIKLPLLKQSEAEQL